MYRLDNSVMKACTDLDVFMSKMYQLRDKLSDLDEVIFTEHLTNIILNALPVNIYPIINIQAVRYPDLSWRRFRIC